MTEWIDVLLYSGFMAMLWFWIPAAGARFTRAIVEDRNPEWVAAHPEVVDRLAGSRWYLRCSYGLGALSIAILISAQTDLWPAALSAPVFESEHWRVLSAVHAVLAITWLVHAVAGGAIFTRWLTTHVPLAERRRASLEPRSVDAYVPGGIRLAVHTAVGLHLAIWLAVGALGRHATSATSFWGMLASQFVIAAILVFIVRIIVRRPPNAMDRVFGPGFRRGEVRYAFLAQLVPLLNGAARLREAMTGTASADMDRMAQLGLVLVMVASALVWFGRFIWPSQPASGRRPSRAGLQSL